MGERSCGLDQSARLPIGHAVAHPQPLRQVTGAIVRPGARSIHLVDGAEELAGRVAHAHMRVIAALDSRRSSISLAHRDIAPIRGRDRFGNLFLSWLGYGRLSYPTVVPTLLSTDAGDDWSLVTKIEPPPAVPAAARLGVRTPFASESGPKNDDEDRGPGFLDQPTITTGARSLWAIWNNEGQMQAVGARVRGLGDVAPFKPVRDIPGGHNCTFGDVAVGPGGAVAEVCQKDQDRHRPVRSVFRFTVDPDGLRPR